MKKTLQEQYLLIKEGKGHKGVFIKEAKNLFPDSIRSGANFKETSDILKQKQIIKENIVEIGSINQIPTTKKESYETAFENFLIEEKKKDYFEDEKAELKKTSKQVEKDLSHMYDNKNPNNLNNQIFGQIMMGYYAEMKNPKNENKTPDQLKSIVLKNLAKNPIYYTEKGQFGDLDLGYVTEVPGLGTPKEPKGEHKSSGYGTLSEGHKGSCKTTHPDMSHDEYEAGLKEGEFDSVKHEFEKKPNNKFTAKEREDKISVLRKKELDRRKKEDLKETQVRKVVKEMIRQELKENVDKRLKAIEEESQTEVLETKAAKIQQEIEVREARMTRLDEDEDMKDLLDKNKIKNLKKEIKVLQKAANKVAKILDKVNKKNAKSDEPKEEIVGEAEGDPDDAAKTADELERAAAAAKEIADTDILEKQPDAEQASLSKTADEAEEMFVKFTGRDNGKGNMSDKEALTAVLNEFPNYMEREKDFVERHLRGRYHA